jgi:hypothetical protein
MTVPVYDGTVAAYECVHGPGATHAHVANPDWPGYALCLVKLTGLRRISGDCPECLRLLHANRSWIGRE